MRKILVLIVALMLSGCAFQQAIRFFETNPPYRGHPQPIPPSTGE